jgi:hypothetical protein
MNIKAEEITVLKISYAEDVSGLHKTHRILHPAHSNFVFAIPRDDIEVVDQAVSIHVKTSKRNQSATPPQPSKTKPV